MSEIGAEHPAEMEKMVNQHEEQSERAYREVPILELDAVEHEDVYTGSVYEEMLEEQKKIGLPKTAIFVDIDNTHTRKDRLAASRKLSVDAAMSHVPLIAITGNSVEGVVSRIEAGELPCYPIIVGSTGTEPAVLTIDEHGKPVYRRDKKYTDELLKRFSRPEIAKAAKDIILQENVSDEETIPNEQLFYQQYDIEKQYLSSAEDEKVNEQKLSVQPLKFSCYFFTTREGEYEQVTAMKSKLEAKFAQKDPKPQIVICEEIGYNESKSSQTGRLKFCVDIVPATKADAADHLAQAGGLDFTVVAGDSANDGHLATGDFAILVGGAKPEMQKKLTEIIKTYNQQPDRIGGRFEQTVEEGDQKWNFNEAGFGSSPSRSARLGPESINHALRVLLRATMRYKGQAQDLFDDPINQAEVRKIYDRISGESYDEDTEAKLYTKSLVQYEESL